MRACINETCQQEVKADVASEQSCHFAVKQIWIINTYLSQREQATEWVLYIFNFNKTATNPLLFFAVTPLLCVWITSDMYFIHH